MKLVNVCCGQGLTMDVSGNIHPHHEGCHQWHEALNASGWCAMSWHCACIRHVCAVLTIDFAMVSFGVKLTAQCLLSGLHWVANSIAVDSGAHVVIHLLH